MLNVASGFTAYRFRALSEKPPDSRHHYGHSLLEVYGSVWVLVLMAAAFSFVALMAIARIEQSIRGRVDPIGVVFAIASLALNIGIGHLLRTFGAESIIARTEARHITLDVAEGLLTLIGVSLGAYISAAFDLAAAFLILALVALLVIQTLRELRASILAESPPEDIVRRIEETLKGIKGVRGVHDLRIRQAGAKIFADVHLEVDGTLTVEEAHQICDEAEEKVKREIGDIDIVIHVEPE